MEGDFLSFLPILFAFDMVKKSLLTFRIPHASYSSRFVFLTRVAPVRTDPTRAKGPPLALYEGTQWPRERNGSTLFR